ncbi:protein of unknown function [Microbacterium sp. Nx66]|nr:protein of unknown function [Microbacterium sp. Nx66]
MVCSFCACAAACRLSRLFRLEGTLRQGVWLFSLALTVRRASDIRSQEPGIVGIRSV